MKKVNKKGVITSGLAITAFLAAAIIFVLLLYTEKKVLDTEEKNVVCVALCEIPAGTDINEITMKQYFAAEERYVSSIPVNALTDYSSLSGKAAVFTISSGTIITANMFRESDVGSRGMKEPVLLGFKVEDIYQVAGGILRTGDIVHVYIIDELGEAVLRWENVCIEDTFDSSGNRILPEDNGRATRFNIFFEKADVEEFYSSLDSGRIRIVRK